MLRTGGSFTIPIPEFSPCQLCFDSIPSAVPLELGNIASRAYA